MGLLVVGAVAGVLAAGVGLLRTHPRRTLPAADAARVNGQPISRETYERALAGLARDRRSGLARDDRRHVLARLIDEELLLQRALALGLAREDVRARNVLTAAVIAAAAAAADGAAPPEAELRAFHERERAFFTGPGQVRVRQIWLRGAAGEAARAAGERAGKAASRLRAGEDFETVRHALGDPELPPLPTGPIPAGRLDEHLGPTAARTVLGLPVGGVSDPVRTAEGYRVLELVARAGGAPPPFEAVRGEVLAEFRRRAADTALRAYLDDLRGRAEIAIAPDLR